MFLESYFKTKVVLRWLGTSISVIRASWNDLKLLSDNFFKNINHNKKETDLYIFVKDVELSGLIAKIFSSSSPDSICLRTKTRSNCSFCRKCGLHLCSSLFGGANLNIFIWYDEISAPEILRAYRTGWLLHKINVIVRASANFH